MRIIDDGTAVQPLITDLETARSYFADDKYATELTGIEIEDVSQGYAKVTLSLTPQHRNAAGLVMGAVYYTMADFAFAVAANFNAPLTLTMEASIKFMSSAGGDLLTAEAREISRSSSFAFYEVIIKDNLDNQVALVTTTGFSPR